MDAIESRKNQLYRLAFGLAVFTIIYNIIEGFLCTYIGAENESLTLFGFGVDSFIEVVSGIGIAQMVLRIKRNPDSSRGAFEKTALRITGYSFYILVGGLVLTSLYNIYSKHMPQISWWGAGISLFSIGVMYLLIIGKTKAGKGLDSAAILADTECTRVCIYMSIILLLSSSIYALTQIPYIDSIGTLGLSYFAYKEGRECMEKAEHDTHCSCD